MASFKDFLKHKKIVFSGKRYGIDALGAMAQGLFCSLLIGTIIKTLGQQLNVQFLVDIGTYAMAVSGPAMAVAIGRALQADPMVLFSLAAVGWAANAEGGAGGPLAVLIIAIIAAECGKAVSKETKVDILVTPAVTILVGVALAKLIAPPIGKAANAFGLLIDEATKLQPFWMGIAVSVLVGIALTLPISSAAICAVLGLTGLAGGAAVAGCCAQMIGFAVISFKENRFGGLVSQGLGTSMLQMPNIVKNPKIWIPATLASAVTGPIATCVFKLQMNGAPINSGMGTCGMCGPIGVITGFIVYVSLFQEPLAQIGQASSTIQLGTAACNRVFTFLEQEELPDEGDRKQLLDHDHIRGEVEFKDVCFGYDPKKLTITNFSGKIKPGMKVAIIGPTGAGKTTLVNLLMRFYEITSGDILVDGVSIKDMSRHELREIFGMILQETWVINGTLRENIVYNLKNVDENRLQEILEETNLSHYVDTLPQGLDTEIQKESALSAGQKQLVTIARAMTENAPMLILDEATSNVDTRTEILIQKAMDSLTSGRTSFVIAHRLSTIKNADLIFVMKDGNIVETGNHDSLMELGGLYSEIYNSQFN